MILLRSLIVCLRRLHLALEIPQEYRLALSLDSSLPSREPENAYTAIHYRGSWFYIDDSDLTSKSTFSLLTQLFALQAGEIKSTGPILTLPVTH